MRTLARVHMPGDQFALEHCVQLLLAEPPVTEEERLGASDSLHGQCRQLWESLGEDALAGFTASPALLRLLAGSLDECAAQLGPKLEQPEDWCKQPPHPLPCQQGERCPACSALQAFLEDPGEQEVSLRQEEDWGHLAQWADEYESYRWAGRPAKRCDIEATSRWENRVRSWTLRKSHTLHARQLAVHTAVLRTLRVLGGAWVQCLLRLLGGSDVGSGAGGQAQPDKPAPLSPSAQPAKKAGL
ncbi:hypothetical protein ABPG75_013000 [Micractinium tetrahymenae]